MKLIFGILLAFISSSSLFAQISATYDTLIVWNDPAMDSFQENNWIHNDTDSTIKYLSRRIKHDVSPTLDSYYSDCTISYPPSADTYFEVTLGIGDSCLCQVGFYTQHDSSLVGIVDIEYFNSDTSLILTYILKSSFLNTAIGEELAVSVSLYPNPSQGKLFLQHELETSLSFEIYGISGKKYFSSQVEKGSTEFDISHLPPGFYFVSMSNERGSFQQKLILSH